MQAVNVAEMRRYQSDNILSVLEALGIDFMVERTPLGETQVSVTLSSGEAFVCMGVSVRDALGQLTGALALEFEVEVETCEERDESTDADKPIGFSLEAPVEFCKRFVQVSDPELTQLSLALADERDTMPAPELAAVGGE